MTLPTNIDASYPDRSAGDAVHQQHHDAVHAFYNKFDHTAAPAAGNTWVWDATAGVYKPGSGASVPAAAAVRTAGNVVINSSTAFVAVDTALDLTLGAVAGDIIEVGVSFQCSSEAVNLQVDAGTVVAAAVANRISRSTAAATGVPGWHVRGGNFFPASGARLYTLVAGDIEAGTVTLRLLAATETAANRTIQAVAGNPLQFYAKNLGQ